MTKIKICGCYYDDINSKRHFGIEILNRKTNIFIIINKKLEKVPSNQIKGVVTCEQSIGNIIIDL